MMATEAIKLITGTGTPLLGRLLFIDVLAATQREIPVLPQDPSRPRTVPAAPRGVEPATDPGTEEPAPTVTASDLTARLEDGQAPFVLDVRDAAEVATGVIPGADHIPVATLTSDTTASAELPTDRDVVLVCRSGARARLAATALRARGFTRLAVLEGGMLAWEGPVRTPEETTRSRA